MNNAFVLLTTTGGEALALLFYIFWLRRRFPRTKTGAFRLGLPALAVFLILFPFASRLAMTHVAPRALAWIHGLGILTTVALGLSAPLVVAWEIALRIAFGGPRKEPAVADAAALDPHERSDGRKQSRREALAAVGGTTLSMGVSAVIGWGMVRGRHDMEVVETPIRLRHLPRELDGFRIVQVSDIHVGAFFGERDLRQAEELIRPLRADLVVMTGDLVHLQPAFIPMAAAWMARLNALSRHGAVAIPGNHEYYTGCKRVLDALRAAGVDVLFNQGRIIAPSDGGGFALVGVDDLHGAYTKKGPGPRVAEALAQLPPDRARVLLCHQPTWLPQAASWGFDLMLAGHVHGGQIAPVGPLVARAAWGYVAGHYQVGDCQLWLNRGLGTSGAPSRVAVRPEITKIVLVAG